jgi:hypothetical protein
MSSLEKFRQHHGAALDEMLVPIRLQDRVQSLRRPGDEVDTLDLEQRAVVLLREC